MAEPNRYVQIIERIFLTHYEEGIQVIPFEREEIVSVARELNIDLPKNLGDLIYSFRYRANLPETIQRTAKEGATWIIRPAGRSRYCFSLVPQGNITPNALLAETKILDATPGIVSKYALSDEQALLAKLRYNRLVDTFTGVTCYSLQNHLRTTVPNLGQVETDEIYIGVDRRGAHYVFPVQAKGKSDRLSIVQIEQDFALCSHKFSDLICRPIAAQFMGRDLIVLFDFETTENGLAISSERHYRLVQASELSKEELSLYRSRPA
jgi:hypothetical protein